MPSHKQGTVVDPDSFIPFFAEAYRALELLEHYCTSLENQPGSEELQETLKKAIVAIRSRLFQALLGKERENEH